MKKNIYAGYIKLKSINGILFTSSIQNQKNREFIENELKSNFFLTSNENTIGDNNIILNSLINDKSLAGIVMMSVFLLPEKKYQRIDIYNKILKKKKNVYFIIENLALRKRNDIEKIEDTMIFNNNFFTDIKYELSKNEKILFKDKEWQFV